MKSPGFSREGFFTADAAAAAGLLLLCLGLLALAVRHLDAHHGLSTRKLPATGIV